jgi:hypothetical protein
VIGKRRIHARRAGAPSGRVESGPRIAPVQQSDDVARLRALREHGPIHLAPFTWPPTWPHALANERYFRVLNFVRTSTSMVSKSALVRSWPLLGLKNTYKIIYVWGPLGGPMEVLGRSWRRVAPTREARQGKHVVLSMVDSVFDQFDRYWVDVVPLLISARCPNSSKNVAAWHVSASGRIQGICLSSSDST